MQKLSRFDIIWAPWRKKYVITTKSKKCFICACKKISKNNLLIYNSPTIKVLANAFPYNNGHLLVAPVRHVGSLSKLTPQERKDLMDVIIVSQEILQQILNPQGFNIGLNLGKVAGAGLVSHLHFHIVPRWQGDTNFVPILSSTKIIPDSLRSLVSVLRDVFAKRFREAGR